VVADCERGTPRAALFDELAQAADEQAEIWLAAITQKGGPPPAPFRPDLRTRIVARLTRSFKPRAMRGVLAAMKVRGMALYSHTPPHAMPLKRDDIGKRHQSGGAGNALRAGVFGVNDGLVSNAALIYGVAGAAQEPSVILLTGVAGLLAGAFSMAAGEYVFGARAARNVRIPDWPGTRRTGNLSGRRSRRTGADLCRQGHGPRRGAAAGRHPDAGPERALDTLAREELGLNPDELGSPWVAASSSFTAFTAGAALPLLPFLFGHGSALTISIALTALGLFAVGASMSLFTGRHAPLSGLRMLGIGGAAGLATYFIGAWLGVTLG